MSENQKPKGYFIKRSMGMGILIFGVFGFLVQTITSVQYIFLPGMVVGMAIGLLMGFIIEGKKNEEGKVRDLTIKEQKNQKIRIIIAFAFMFLSFLIFLAFSIFKS